MQVVMMPVYPNDGPILSGQNNARLAFDQFRSLIPGGRQLALMVMDFADVEVATATYLRESVVAFRDYLRTTTPHCYLTVANLSHTVEEELNNYLHWTRDALQAAEVSTAKTIVNGGFLGEMDPALQATFYLINKKGSATAAELHAGNHEMISLTAWNNRLNALTAKSLLIENTHGRSKRYHTMFPNGRNLVQLSR